MQGAQPHGFEEKAQPRQVLRGAQCHQQQQAGVVQGAGQKESRLLVRRPQPARPGADHLPQPPDRGETVTLGHRAWQWWGQHHCPCYPPTTHSSLRPTELGAHFPVVRWVTPVGGLRAKCWPRGEGCNRGHHHIPWSSVSTQVGQGGQKTAGLGGRLEGPTCSVEGQPTAHQPGLLAPSAAARSRGGPSTGGWRKAEGRKRGSETRGFPVMGAGGPDSPQLCWTPGRVWEGLSHLAMRVWELLL